MLRALSLSDMETPPAWAGRERPSDLPTSGVNIDVSSVAADFSDNPLKAVYVGTAGNLKVTFWEDDNPVETAVPAGTYFVGVIKTVHPASATAATDLLGLR